MKIYAIYAQMVEEPVCYVEAENIDDLIKTDFSPQNSLNSNIYNQISHNLTQNVATNIFC